MELAPARALGPGQAPAVGLAPAVAGIAVAVIGMAQERVPEQAAGTATAAAVAEPDSRGRPW